MTRNKKLALSILIIFFVAFNLIVFLAPFVKTPTFWITYGFTVFAFLIQIIIGNIAFSHAVTMKSKFIGFPIFYIGIVYLIIQVILGFVIMLLSTNIPVWVAIISYFILLAISGFCLITTEIGRGEINRIESEVQNKVIFIKSLQADTDILYEKATDQRLKEDLKKLSEAVKFSDPMSDASLSQLESQIENEIVDLKRMFGEQKFKACQPMIKDIQSLLIERNKKCEFMK